MSEPSEAVRKRVPGLVEHHLARVRDSQHRGQPESGRRDAASEFRALGPEFGDGLLDVVAHEADLMVLAGRWGTAARWGRVHAKLGRAGAEDEPAVMHVDVRPAENITEERARRLGILGIDKGVDRGDHAASLGGRIRARQSVSCGTALAHDPGYPLRRNAVIADSSALAIRRWNRADVSRRASVELRMLPHSISTSGTRVRLSPARSSRGLMPRTPS